jgi:hypothetical protein
LYCKEAQSASSLASPALQKYAQKIMDMIPLEFTAHVRTVSRSIFEKSDFTDDVTYKSLVNLHSKVQKTIDENNLLERY